MIIILVRNEVSKKLQQYSKMQQNNEMDGYKKKTNKMTTKN